MYMKGTWPLPFKTQSATPLGRHPYWAIQHVCRTEGSLRQGLLNVEDGAGLGAGVVMVQVRQLAGQGAAHVLIDDVWVDGW